uniref:Corrinoid adenosyltransferase MMAB n=1 Tax=Syphacia muris TaxID=451379 RepID=A0A0N5B1J0_9BILA
MFRPSSLFIQRSLGLGGISCFHQSSVLRKGFKKGRGTGDQGKSSLYSNERRWKDDPIFNALGTIDELSSKIGVCRNYTSQEGLFDVSEVLIQIQSCLQDVGAHVATPPDSLKTKIEKTKFDTSMFEFVDKNIDVYGDRIPPLREFILTGGNNASSEIQYARSICRRAERCLIPLLRDESIDRNALRFLNRLADLLFVLGRYVCVITKTKEARYQKFHEYDPLKSFYDIK